MNTHIEELANQRDLPGLVWCWRKGKADASKALRELRDPRVIPLLLDVAMEEHYKDPESADRIWEVLEAFRENPADFDFLVQSIIGRLNSFCASKGGGFWSRKQWECLPQLAAKTGDRRLAEPLFRAAEVGLWHRVSMARALAELGDPRGVEVLIGCLEFTGAAEALGHLKDVRAIDPLIAALRSKHRGVRSAAAAALAKFDDPRAAEAIAALPPRECSAVETPADALPEPDVDTLRQQPDFRAITSALGEEPLALGAFQHEGYVRGARRLGEWVLGLLFGFAFYALARILESLLRLLLGAAGTSGLENWVIFLVAFPGGLAAAHWLVQRLSRVKSIPTRVYLAITADRVHVFDYGDFKVGREVAVWNRDALSGTSASASQDIPQVTLETPEGTVCLLGFVNRGNVAAVHRLLCNRVA